MRVRWAQAFDVIKTETQNNNKKNKIKKKKNWNKEGTKMVLLILKGILWLRTE